jgi:hypothetical protein
MSTDTGHPGTTAPLRELYVGMKLKDNDTRMPGCTMVVHEIGRDSLILRNPHRDTLKGRCKVNRKRGSVSV